MNKTERIRDGFAGLARGIIRWRWVFPVFFMVLFCFSFTGLKQIRFDVSNESWFLDDDPMQVAEDKFKAIFDNNDYAAILYEADNVFLPEHLNRIRTIGKALVARVPHADEVLSLTDLEYTSGTDGEIMVGQLVPDPVPTGTEALADIRRKAMGKPTIVNRLVSQDGRQAWILLRLKPYPETGQKIPPDIATGKAVLKVTHMMQSENARLTATGYPVINAQKKGFFSREMRRNLKLSLVVALGVLALAVRTLQGVLFPAIFTVGSVVIVMGLQGHMGISMDPSVLMVPVYLSLAVGVSYTIHLFVFFQRRFAETGQRRAAMIQAVGEVGWPITFTALTTMGAMVTFMVVPVRQIRWIGGTSAALVLVNFLMMITLVPGVLSMGRDKAPQAGRRHIGSSGEKILERLGAWVLGHSRLVMVLFALVTCTCLAGLPRFQAGFDVRKSFGVKIPYVADMDHVGRSQIGSIYAYDLLIEFPSPEMAKSPDVLHRLDALIREADAQPLTKRTTSVLDVIRDLNQTVNEGKTAFYAIPQTREMIAQLMLLYENSGGVEVERWIDYDYQRLRVMVEMRDYNSVEAARELEVLGLAAARLFPEATCGFVGTIAQFSVMQKYVYTGQIISFGLAILVITLLMILVFGSVKTGLIGMVPNITPALIIGGIMGWADIPLNMMTITIMPMLLGLAVDDTIHFITHAKAAVRRTGHYRTGILRTFGAIGVPLILTSLVIISNFAVYTTSIANVYIQVGILAGIGVLTALLTDFFITPILIQRFRPFDTIARCK